MGTEICKGSGAIAGSLTTPDGDDSGPRSCAEPRHRALRLSGLGQPGSECLGGALHGACVNSSRTAGSRNRRARATGALDAGKHLVADRRGGVVGQRAEKVWRQGGQVQRLPIGTDSQGGSGRQPSVMSPHLAAGLRGDAPLDCLRRHRDLRSAQAIDVLKRAGRPAFPGLRAGSKGTIAAAAP
jgi:hypothetical protein